MPPRCTPPTTCSRVGPSCCTGRDFSSTTGKGARAAATSWESSTGEWWLRAGCWAAANSSCGRCSAPSRGPLAAGATRCWFNRGSPTRARRCTIGSTRTTCSWSSRPCTSGRLTVNPGPRWSVSTWYAYLKSPEGLHPDESLHRIGASALTTQPVGTKGTWSSALIYGANDQIGPGPLASSVVLESTVDLDGTNSFFGRVEYVRKSAEELVIPSVPPTTQYDVGALALGYLRTVGTVAGLVARGGVRGSLNFVPSSLDGAYGSRTPVGAAIYLQLRPADARESGRKMNRLPGMHGGSHD